MFKCVMFKTLILFQLKEDREKFRKSLETEQKKLQGNINEGATSFDEKLSQLFQRKIKTEMVICQVTVVMVTLQERFKLQ